MEIWQQEALSRRRPPALGLCQCCGEPVQTEQYLDLRPFGLQAVACERCVDRNLHSSERRNDA